MWPCVASTFAAFTERFEGHVPFMYCDVKGLVTTGRGNLIDPVTSALVLPWQISGMAATRLQIATCWQVVKSRQDICQQGGMAYQNITDLRLAEEAIDALTNSKMLEMETHLKARFPLWETLPADAQLAVLSMAWACGPAFHFPKFEAALVNLDMWTCAVECHLDETGNPGLKPRNVANSQLFKDAATSTDPSQFAAG